MFQRLIKWHDSWCPPTVCGGRPGSDALHTALEIGLTVEEAIALHQRGLLIVSLDLSKFFGSIEWGLIDKLSEKGDLARLARENTLLRLDMEKVR